MREGDQIFRSHDRLPQKPVGQMLAILFAAAGSASMNFTHIFIGNWTVNTSRLSPDGTEELVPTQTTICIRSGVNPGSLDGDVFSEDADGVLAVTTICESPATPPITRHSP
jgi:hypothetical protein